MQAILVKSLVSTLWIRRPEALSDVFLIAVPMKKPHFAGMTRKPVISSAAVRNAMMNLKTLPVFFAVSLSVAMTAPMALAREASLSGNFLASRSANQIKDSDAAAKYLGAALSQDPQNPNIIERLFQLELSNGNLPGAERLAKQVLEFNSQHRMARTVLGLREFKERRYEQARQNFAEASYTPAGELTATLLTAWSYAGEGALNAAMTELDKLDANESFANFKSYHSGLIADYLGSAIRAEVSYKKAYQEAGSSMRITQAYGSFLERNNRPQEARKVYETFLLGGAKDSTVEATLNNLAAGVKAKPFIETPLTGAGEVMFSLAAAMNDDQSIDVAVLFAQLAVSLHTDKPVMLNLLGDIQSTRLNYQAANETYEKIPLTSELRIHTDMEIAVNLQRMERYTEAEAKMRDIVKREPSSFEAWATLGNLLRNNDKFTDAAKAYDAALKLVPKLDRSHWSIFYYRGIANERQKQWPQAEADFRQALVLSPQEPSVLNYLGYSLIDKNEKLDEALAMVKKAVELKPNDGYIVDSLGWAYFQLRDYEAAVAQLERAVDIKAGDPIIAEHLGDAYWRVGRKLEAGFQWNHAKVNKPEPEDLVRIEGKIKNGMVDLTPVAKPAAGASNG